MLLDFQIFFLLPRNWRETVSSSDVGVHWKSISFVLKMLPPCPERKREEQERYNIWNLSFKWWVTKSPTLANIVHHCLMTLIPISFMFPRYTYTCRQGLSKLLIHVPAKIPKPVQISSSRTFQHHNTCWHKIPIMKLLGRTALIKLIQTFAVL